MAQTVTKIPTETQRNAARKLLNTDLANRYIGLLRAGVVDGNEIEFLEFEIRRRWLERLGIDIQVVLSK